MSTYTRMRSSRYRSPAGMKRGAANASRQPLFVADESWSRSSGTREAAGEKDDYSFMVEPGFWLTILLACLPIMAGCVYLLLTEG